VLYVFPMHSFLRTSGRDLLSGMRSEARRLNRLIWNSLWDFGESNEGRSTGEPSRPSEGEGEKLFAFKMSGINYSFEIDCFVSCLRLFVQLIDVDLKLINFDQVKLR